ncbi:MAG: transposase [Anaerolineae bacterium]|nr:transposase [Anaerolineae bacterium]
MRLLAPDGTRRWLAVGQYAAELKGADFTQVAWPTQDGSKPMYVHLVRTWVHELGPCQVLIVKPGRDAPPAQWRYWATSRLEDTLKQVVAHVTQRWTIEDLFSDCKELLGSDHYQVRSAPGIIRFWALGLDSATLLL